VEGVRYSRGEVSREVSGPANIYRHDVNMRIRCVAYELNGSAIGLLVELDSMHVRRTCGFPSLK
jgi:hypothetical protein